MNNDDQTAGLKQVIDDEDLQALAAQYDTLFLNSVPDDMLDPALVTKLPVEWARSHCVLPVRCEGKLCVLTADAEQVDEHEYLALLIGQELKPVFASAAVIAESIERCYYSKDDSPEEFIQDLGVPDLEIAEFRSDDLFAVAEKAPVTQLVNLILLDAVKKKASDVHFEPYESNLRVRYRIDGVLYEQSSPPKKLEESIVSRLKVMARMDIAEKRLPQDGMARVRVGGREIDLRVSTVPVAEGERVVLRILDKDSTLLPLGVLGMPGPMLDSFSALMQESNGIVVVSGPTGSGKTTTLYAALGGLDASRKNIMTIENPIEYQLTNIGQIQVKPKIGLTFANGLRHILRQDPDIILVGETRDIETADIAIRASLTGHLVFTTLHTNDSPGAVLRLLDMGVEPYLLASCLRGVLSQRLVRRLCPECRKETIVRQEDVREIGEAGAELVGSKAWEPAGCPKCLEGYRGRIGIFELMVVDQEMQGMIRAGKTNSAELRRIAEDGGMLSLARDGVSKVLNGTTSLSDFLSVTVQH